MNQMVSIEKSEWVEFCDLSTVGANTCLSKKFKSATSDGVEIVAQRFQTLKKLDHPNLLKCHKLLHLGDEFVILCDSDSVVDVSPVAPDSISDLANIARQMVSLLSYLHKNNIWHGGVEPSGIFMDSNRNVKVLPPVKFLYDTIPLGIDIFTKDVWDLGFSILKLYRQSCSTFTNSSDEVLWRFLLCSMRTDLSERWNAPALADHPFLKTSIRWRKVIVPLEFIFRLKRVRLRMDVQPMHLDSASNVESMFSLNGTLMNSSPSLRALIDEIDEGFDQVMKEILRIKGTEDRGRFLQERVCLSYNEALSIVYDIESGRSLEKSGRNRPGQEGKMPEGLTNSGKFQTFFVGQHDGYRIKELKKINDITGRFSISNLENVSGFEEAKEAALADKKHIHTLDLRWNPNPDPSLDPSEILECLRPHFGVTELEIFYFNGSKLPSWISDPCFTNLTSIVLFNCNGCHWLPSLGKLPALKSLYMLGLEKVRFIDTSVCRSGSSSAYPRLENLNIEKMPNLLEWSGIEDGDFRCLETVCVSYCPKLLLLPSMSHLYSLNELELYHCPRLMSLPGGVFPDSVESLTIYDCPNVKKQCEKDVGQDWAKIRNIKDIWIDSEKMS